MSVRWHSLSDARLTLAAMLAVLAIAWPAAHAQNVDGLLTVSATILPPVAKQVIRSTAFSVARNGSAQLETTAPVAGSVSQIVRWNVSSSAKESVSVDAAPMRIEAAHATESNLPTSLCGMPATRLRFGVELGATNGSPIDSSSRYVTVCIHYLIVPGT
jgi:hypothetical protein